MGYLNVEGMRRAVQNGPYAFCDACFTGDYPVRPDGMDGVQLGLF